MGEIHAIPNSFRVCMRPNPFRKVINPTPLVICEIKLKNSIIIQVKDDDFISWNTLDLLDYVWFTKLYKSTRFVKLMIPPRHTCDDVAMAEWSIVPRGLSKPLPRRTV